MSRYHQLEPGTRFWQVTHDVPGPICWIRGKGDYREHLIIGFAHPVAFITASCGCEPIVMSSHLVDWRMECMEYSTDRKTWHPCVVPIDPAAAKEKR